jgi:purine-binding chemotaxis protein CheW
MSRNGVDWERIKQRLAEGEDALARGYVPTPEARRARLEARARAIAGQPAPVDEMHPALTVVEFELARRRVAIDAAFVSEVRALDTLTPLPCTPGFVAGIVNLHGRMLAVIDLAEFLQLPRAGLEDRSMLLVLQHADTVFAVLADRIVGAHRVPLADLGPAPPTMGAARARCVRALTPGALIILDAQRLMDEPTLRVEDDIST